MTPNKNLIVIKFDFADKNKINIGGLQLLRAERWVFQEDDGENGGTKYDVQRDKKITNPQKGTIVSVCEGSKLKVGQDVFVHYLAYETAQWVDDETAIIKESNVFFTYENENIVPFSDLFFGEEVYVEPERTASGIYISSQDKVKETTKIRITHIPENNKGIRVGDVVLTIDGSQYVFTFNGKQYVKLNESEIVATVTDNQIKPIAA